MRTSKVLMLAAAAVMTVMLFTNSVSAGFWDWTRPFQGPERRVSTLVITGNYKRPLALAQLMQAENRQPYLLIPAKETGEKAIFFCPVSTRRAAMEIKEADLDRFVAFLRPQQIIILGDTTYVPTQYEPQVEPKIPTFRLATDDWMLNAKALGSMLKLNNLAEDFSEIAPKLESNVLYAPVPRKDQSAQATPTTTEQPKTEEEPAPQEAPKVDSQPAVSDEQAVGEVVPVAEETGAAAADEE